MGQGILALALMLLAVAAAVRLRPPAAPALPAAVRADPNLAFALAWVVAAAQAALPALFLGGGGAPDPGPYGPDQALLQLGLAAVTCVPVWAAVRRAPGGAAAAVLLAPAPAAAHVLAGLAAGALAGWGLAQWPPGNAWRALAAVAIGLQEEAAWRGFIQPRLAVRLGPGAALPLTALLFALAHTSQRIWGAGLPPAAAALSSLQLVPIGLFYGWMAWRTRSVWPGAAAHALLDWLAG